MTDAQHTHPVRYHSLDALRAIAMLLGIVLHGVMAYMTDVWSVWPADDAASTSIADYVFGIIHLFRMQVFFLMAGFFACMLFARYGVKRFSLHRLKRIALPLAVGMYTVVPAWRTVMAYGLPIRYGAEEPTSLWAATLATVVPDGSFLFQHPAHLWFLQVLLVLYAIAIVWLWIASKVGVAATLNAQATRAAGWLLRHRLMTVALIALTFPLLSFQSGFVVDTQSGWLPAWNIVAFYMVFFTAGWLIFHHREQLDRLADWWIAQLVIGFALVPVLLGMANRGFGAEATAGRNALIYLISSAVTALLVVGFTGMFLRVFHRQSKVMRYISDSAYWLYLAHLPVVVLINILILPWQAGAMTKFIVVMLLASAFLLGTYQLCVRHTPIGVLLSGKKGKTLRAEAPLPEPVAVT